MAERAPGSEVSVSQFSVRADQPDYVILSYSDLSLRTGGYEHRLLVIDSQFQVLNQINLDHRPGQIFGADQTADGDADLLVTYVADSACGFTVYHWPDFRIIGQFETRASDFPERGDQPWDASLGAIGVVQNFDSAPCLLLQISSGKGRLPRGLMLVDPLSGEVKWFYGTAGKIESAAITDVNEDGRLDVLLGIYGPANGALWNKARDDCGVLEAVTIGGELLWRTVREGSFSGFTFLPPVFPSGPSPQLITLSYTNYALGGPHRIQVVNAADGARLHDQILPAMVPMNMIFAWNPDSAGNSRSVFTLADDVLMTFSASGVLNQQGTRFNRVLLTYDLDNDSLRELIGIHDHHLTVLDHELSPLAVLSDVVDHAYLTVQRTGRGWPYLWMRDARGIHRLTIAANPEAENFERRQTMMIAAWSLLGLSASVGSWFGARWVIRTRRALRQARIERAQTQAMVSVVRTIGHEMQYPLSLLEHAAFGLRTLFGQRTEETSQSMMDCLANFHQAGQELSDTSLTLRKFVGLIPPQLESLQLEDVVREALSGQAISEGIQVNLSIAEALPSLRADRKQLKSITQNLVKNSVKAMNGAGQLTINLSLIRRGSHLDSRDSRVRLQVADTGCGIKRSDLKRVFDPGFSAFAEGTGLGLAVVKKAVSDHGGEINLSSEVGRGTLVTIDFPQEKGG